MTAAISIEVPIGNLTPHRRNVRKSKTSKEADKELIASMRAVGLIQPLTVVRGKAAGIYEVVAGKRRLISLQKLHKEGHYTDEQTIPCQLYEETDINIEEIGLIENTHRAKMHPADDFEAFRKMQKSGHSVQDIALHFGISDKTVYQRLQLANVATEIIKAYRNDELTLEAVMAFSAEADKQRQLGAFTALKEAGTNLFANRIRHELTDHIESSGGKLGRFVGRKAYEKAGGSISTDFFQDTLYFNDGDILTNLAIEKLNRAANKLSDDWNWTEITIDAPDTTMKTITGYDTPDTQALREKASAIDDKIDMLNLMNEEDWEPKHGEQEERLQEQLDKMEDAITASLSYKPEEQALAGCIVSIWGDGALLVQKGLVRKSDEKKLAALHQDNRKTNPGSDDSSSSKSTGQQSPEPESNTLSQALTSDLSTYRLNIIKAHLARNETIARYLLYYNLCMATFSDAWYGHDLDIRIKETSPASSQTKPDTGRAIEDLQAQRDDLPLDWMHIENDGQRFAAFVCLPDDQKANLMAYCVATSLYDTLDAGSMKVLDIPWHNQFKPTVDNYLGRIPKGLLIEHGKPFLGDDWAEAAEKRTKKELASDLEDLFGGEAHWATLSDEKRADAIDWIPDGLNAK